MRFVVLDESTAATATPELGGALTPALVSQIAAALMIQLNRDVATFWGGDYVVRSGAAGDVPAVGEIVCAIVDTLPDAPGDVAYHDTTGNETPVVFCSRAACSSILSGPGSIASALSHELCETAGDPACNRWADQGNGREIPIELCDSTQEDGYEIAGVTVSNFVVPAFFAPGAPGPWTYLGEQGHETVPGPFGLAPGGYQTQRSITTGDGITVNGQLGRREDRASHWSSRAYRRRYGVRA